MAKTLQSAVETLERDKAQLQSRVHSLEQRLMGAQASEEGDKELPPSGEKIPQKIPDKRYKKIVCVLFFLTLTYFCR